MGQSREPPRVVDALRLEGRLRFCAALKAVAYRQRRPGRHNCANVTNSSAIAKRWRRLERRCVQAMTSATVRISPKPTRCALGLTPADSPQVAVESSAFLTSGGRRQLRADVGLPAQTRR